MKKILLLILVSFYWCSGVSAQVAGKGVFTLQAKVSGLPGNEVYLLCISGHRKTFIDSAAVNEEGEFAFSINTETNGNNVTAVPPSSKGLYEVMLGQTAKDKFFKVPPRSFYAILSGSDVVISTSFESPIDSMVVISGGENKLYYDYIKEKKIFNKKLDLLENILDNYPDDCNLGNNNTADKSDCFYKQLQNQFALLQNDLLAYTNNLIKDNPNTLFSEIVHTEQFPYLDASISKEARLEALKEHYFKTSDFEDTLLLHTDAISNKIISYLALFRDKELTEEEQSKAFIKAVNYLLPVAQTGDTKVYKFVLDYTLEGFNEIKQDAVLAYITDNYIAENSCSIDDDKLKAILQKTADYKRIAIGAIAPEIIFNGSGLGIQDVKSASNPESSAEAGQVYIKKLSDIHAEHTLVLFWASWCPHCTKALPELKKIYEDYKSKGLEVLAISLDEDTLQWAKAIADGQFDWLNYSEFKKWNSPSALLYNVHGTPTMFLLDKDKKIIAKPQSAEQLISFLVPKN